MYIKADSLSLRKLKQIITAFIFVLAVAITGVYLLVSSHAQTPYASVEASNGNLKGRASLASDSDAANGTYVQFGGQSNTFGSLPPGQTTLVNDIRSLTATTQTDLAGGGAYPTVQYYDNVGNNEGFWQPFSKIEAQSDEGPGTEAAFLWHYSGENNTTLFERAEGTFNYQVATNLASNGEAIAGGPQFIDNQLTDIYLQLEDGLSAATQSSWQSSINEFMNYLISNGSDTNLYNSTTCVLSPSSSFTYYINGNQNIGETLLAYKAWLVTGNPCYKTIYNDAMNFTLYPDVSSPPSTSSMPLPAVNETEQTEDSGRWKGYGLMETTVPTNSSCSNGAGYLSEDGSDPGYTGTEPGYDPDYTDFQLSLASELYVLTKSPTALCLANLFANQQLQHMDNDGIVGSNNGMPYEDNTTNGCSDDGLSWVVDALNGSRHNLCTGGFDCGFITLAWMGGRTDLLPYIQSQFNDAISSDFLQDANSSAPGAETYRDYGLDLSTLYELTYL
jgi:hypothetical protein